MLKKNRFNSRVVLLGGGFISKEISKLLKNNKRRFLLIERKKIDFLKKNSIKKINKYIKEGDTVFIIAAEAPVKNMTMFFNNIIILKNILSGLENKKIFKVIYLSSDAVYSDSMRPLNEKSKTDPDNLHGLMHKLREQLLLNSYKEKTLIFRSTLVYGQSDPHNGYGPNQFVRSAKKNKLIKIFGKGEELRDHIWVKDLTKMICDIIYNKKKDVSGIFNIASGKILSFKRIAFLIKNNFNKIVILNIPRKILPPHNGYRPIDISKFKKYSKIRSKNISLVLKKILKKYKQI